TGKDIDLVVVGSAAELGRNLARQFGGDWREHERFGTGCWTPEEAGLQVELASVRRERYARPGELPLVEAGTLDEDLKRRDFSVNSMALRLWPVPAGALLDPCGGRAALEAGLLRVIHPDSFLDDPTRACRAARFAARLDFRLEAETRVALRRLLGTELGRAAVERVSGARWWSEWEQICAEANPAACVRQVLSWGIGELLGLAALEDEVTTGRESGRGLPWEDGLQQLRQGGEWSAAGALALVLAGRDCSAALARFERRGRPAERLQHRAGVLQRLGSVLDAAEGLVELDDCLGPCDAVERLLLASSGSVRAEAVRRWEAEAQACRPVISGHDLVAAGWSEGPELGRALTRVRRAQLEGTVSTAAEALDMLGSRAEDKG
ncbi:MAG: hypothetical protein VX498_04365, partial [Myxococcota bacterium]|nr:hypothetical protein [Myxococcota bacterium]